MKETWLDWIRNKGWRRWHFPVAKCLECKRYFSKRRRGISPYCSKDCVEMAQFYLEHPEMRQLANATIRATILGDESAKAELEQFFKAERDRFRRSGA